MKRKMLIPILLLIVMILNCISPLFVVNAADDEVNEGVLLNSKLYIAVRNSLRTQGIDFSSNDFTNTLIVKDVESITQLNLNESSISDLTGLDYFTNLEHLELSGNRLTKDSNLAVLNNFKNLKHLDLSTNHIEDISEIKTLKNKIDNIPDGKFIITGQKVSKVYTVCVDTGESANHREIEEFELPQILDLLGILKSPWKTITSIPETPNSDKMPSISRVGGVPMIPEEGSKVKVNISDSNGNGLFGLVLLNIFVHDDETEAAQANNINRASENALCGSNFDLYYVVYADTCEAITTMDTNLYNAIKEQLTGGQKINSELESYAHATDEDGNALYLDYLYNVNNEKVLLYRKEDENNNPIFEYILNTLDGNIYYYTTNMWGEPELGNLYSNTKDYESTVIQKIDSNGQITFFDGYKIPAKGINGVAKNLYVAAYDSAKTFVIKDNVLTNKITSLNINNNQIRDLSGIEHFVGLTSNLNVSHNYLEGIDPVYSLETNKDAWQGELIVKYKNWQNGRSYGNLSTAVATVKGSVQELYNQEKNIENAAKQIEAIIKEVAQLQNSETGDESSQTSYADKIIEKRKAINKILDDVYGYTDDNNRYVKGYLDKINDKLSELQGYELNAVYEYLSVLYDLYNNEYRLATLLSEHNNYITAEEYLEYCSKTIGSRDSAYSLLTEEITYLTQLEATDSISQLENRLLYSEFGVTANPEEATLAEYFNNLLEHSIRHEKINDLLKIIRKIAVYAEMGNYCLIKRMNEPTGEGYCYEEKYLKNKITDLEYDDIDAEIEKEILNNIIKYEENPNLVTDPMFITYMNYKNSMEYKTIFNSNYKTRIYPCEGNYVPVRGIGYNEQEYDTNELIYNATSRVENVNIDAINEVLSGIVRPIYKNLKWYEKVIGQDDVREYVSDEGELKNLFIYRQMITLATKLASGNADRYVVLPRLKALDFSYNAELANLQGITTLKDTLIEINAEYCYIADIDNINWAEMTNLKRLNLGYNYISDIRSLSAMKNLRSLNLRNNLISGELQITATDYYTIYGNLQELDLSGNQITDIYDLLKYLHYVADGNFANYIARDDTININLNNQRINIEVDRNIDILEYPTTINIDLPPIFSQLLAIDVDRTAFGETSQDGRIESEGKYVVLNTRSVGDKVGTVVVKAMSGNGTNVDTCVGNGTTARISYRVINSAEEKPSLASVRMLNNDKNLTQDDLLNLILQYNGNPSKVTLIFGLEDGTKATEPVEFKINPDVNKKQLLDVDLSEIFRNYYDGEYILRDVYFEYDASEDIVHYSKFAGNTELCDDVNAKALNTNIKFNYAGALGKNPEDPEDPEEPGNLQANIRLGYASSGEKILGVKAETPVEAFKTNLLNGATGYEVVVLDEEAESENREVTSGYIGTGMLVRIEDENGNTPVNENGNPYAFEIIVKGDVDGNGRADRRDSALIKNARAENIELTENQYEAADIDNNGNISYNDSKLLLYHRTEVHGYNLNY